MNERWFVTGTDTGVGKSQVSGALLSLLRDRGDRPFAFKPYETGINPGQDPEDAAWMRKCAGEWQPLDTVCLHRYREPLAPGVAEELNPGGRDRFTETLDAFAKFKGSGVVEGAGGLRVPLDDRHEVIDLIAALKLPVILVARLGLGTLNHIALSLEALKNRGATVEAVVMSKQQGAVDVSEQDNPRWVRKLGVTVLEPVLFRPDPASRHRAFRNALAPLVRG